MSLRFSVQALKQLEKEDLRILNAIERGMAKHMYVPVDVIAKLSRFELEEVEIRLKRLHSLGLVQRQRAAYIGYILTSRGYDCLALNAFIKRGVLSSVSASPIGVGKESEVYKGITPGGLLVTVKVHRVGRVSFRQVKRKRIYVGDREHISWLYESRLAASNEYSALRILHPEGVSVPRPIDWNRHMVITEFIEGIELSEVPPLKSPQEALESIIEEVEKAFNAGVVHGDLSEYNILVTSPDERLVIFDWPQWVPPIHPEAYRLLKRDIMNIAKFFRRKYHVEIDPSALAESVGKKLLGGENS